MIGLDRSTFLRRLENGPLLLDGAMGTMLHDRGVALSLNFDLVNRLEPDLVKAIHKGYIEAGADIIETNTFGANHFKLGKYGLEHEVCSLNKLAVSLARQAMLDSQRPVLLAGSVGPLGVRLSPLGRVSAPEAQAAFEEQIKALTRREGDDPDNGTVDLLILETMPDLEEMALAIKAARKVANNVPLIGMLTFTRDDRTLLGDTAEGAATFLSPLDLDVIGINCSAGPVQVLRILRIFRELIPHKALAAVPNAGWPQQLEGGRLFYPATPAYFADYARSFVSAGASLVGGCCGTTMDHIKAMRQALDDPIKAKRPARVSNRRPDRSKDKIGISGPTVFARKLEEGRFFTTVEMSPPRSTVAHRLLAGASALRDTGADFINVADSPLARMRMGAWAAAHLVQSEVGIETVLHFPTRGRNLLRIQSDLLAAHALNIRNLFVVMGDPTHIGDYPEAMDNYDIVPTGLVQLIKGRLNRGLDQAGRDIGQPTSFTVGCALNLEPVDQDREIRLFLKKAASGADFAITQPIFDPRNALIFIGRLKKASGSRMIPIIAGIQPLFNSGNAEFLHNEVPGIRIPDRIRQRMRAAANPQQEGASVALEIIEEIKTEVQGLYLIPVFGRFDLVADVLDGIGERPV